mgnify:CR=1 FL=1
MPIHLYKPIGLTPLELINKYKNNNNLNNSKFSFAGRLDPMAHGEMIILKDLEVKKQNEYCGLDKEYEFEILFGFSTDTYDILGLVDNYNLHFDKKIIDNFNITNYIGNQEQYYPPYSSIIVNKKPLWLWSRENKLEEIEIPKKKINIYSIESLESSMKYTNYHELYKLIDIRIHSLNEDNYDKFRVKEISKRWKSILLKEDVKMKPIIKRYKIKCSSGTYVRGLTHTIGKELGIGACALEIKRIKIII